MGIVFKPEDIMKGKKHMMKKALRDLTPDLRESVERILQEWEGKPSEEKLVRLVGIKKAKYIFNNYWL